MLYPDLCFKPRLRVINDDQIEQIHLATLEVLERTGVQISPKSSGVAAWSRRPSSRRSSVRPRLDGGGCCTHSAGPRGVGPARWHALSVPGGRQKLVRA